MCLCIALWFVWLANQSIASIPLQYDFTIFCYPNSKWATLFRFQLNILQSRAAETEKKSFSIEKCFLREQLRQFLHFFCVVLYVLCCIQYIFRFREWKIFKWILSGEQQQHIENILCKSTKRIGFFFTLLWKTTKKICKVSRRKIVKTTSRSRQNCVLWTYKWT